MPELVRCPACGVRTATAEVLLGRRVRCPSCGEAFVAGAEPPSIPPLPPRPEPLRSRTPALPPPVPARRRDAESAHVPLCPGCHRPVGWVVSRCPHCGEEFEEASPHADIPDLYRRDADPHRGPLWTTLANFSLLLTGLSPCLFGLPILVSLPLSLVTLLMAQQDLGDIAAGRMDTTGYAAVAAARNIAAVALFLSILMALVAGFIYWRA
jgi:hypothetical protein